MIFSCREVQFEEDQGTYFSELVGSPEFVPGGEN